MTLGDTACRVAARLAVASEPGLTTAQMMLTNHDLKPVEAARRQWGAWNFVGFWIADSFNINTWMIASVCAPSLSYAFLLFGCFSTAFSSAREGMGGERWFSPSGNGKGARGARGRW
jgi:hypothetical protein